LRWSGRAGGVFVEVDVGTAGVVVDDLRLAVGDELLFSHLHKFAGEWK